MERYPTPYWQQIIIWHPILMGYRLCLKYVSPTHAVTEIYDQVGARPPAGQTERALGHPDRAYDHSRDQLQGGQALAYGLSQAPVVTPAVRQPTAKAVGLVTEPAMVPMTSPAMVPASNSDYSVLPDPLAINPNTQERRASSRLAQSKTLSSTDLRWTRTMPGSY